jgi:cysteine sulfinate desulfinase/cysteine desulfurase-like protein
MHLTPFQHAGVIQPTKEIGKMCRERKIFFHTDAAQAVGKIPINVNDHNIDLMSISGHKIYGPKGVGAIYIRRRPRVRLEAQMNGGGQVCTQPSQCYRWAKIGPSFTKSCCQYSSVTVSLGKLVWSSPQEV